MAAIIATSANNVLDPNDLIILVSDTLSYQQLPELELLLQEQRQLDPRVGISPTLVKLAKNNSRCLHVPIPDLSDPYEDVRCFFTLGQSIGKLLDSLDATSPMLALNLTHLPKFKAERFNQALSLAYLGICQQQWQPLEAREALGEQNIEKIRQVSLLNASSELLKFLNATEQGKRVARDLCGTEPERMAPPKFAQYCEHIFANNVVKCEVQSDVASIQAQYPLLFAVARASVEVERHQPRVIKLSYTPKGKIHQTLYFAGKGITYDTGGADLKVNGNMAGMSRDKGGAAAVAGLMQAIAVLKPEGIKVIAQIGAVRNSIGAEAYVPDEIITSHAGIRVRVGNTDAEGRMVLADLLSHMREQALQDSVTNAQLYSVATLTGHALIALGPYTALVENAQARCEHVARNIAQAGEKWGDPSEVSLLRKEDFDFIKPRTKAEDVLSSNNKPSVSTVRGHQFPAAFLAIASGLQAHDLGSTKPLAYTHVDIAGSGVEGMDWQHGKPTGAPLISLLSSLVQCDPTIGSKKA